MEDQRVCTSEKRAVCLISSARCESIRVLKFEIQHFRSQKDCRCSGNSSPTGWAMRPEQCLGI
jgi:hypothetical protein